MAYSHKSIANHNINFFLPADKYDKLRKLCAHLDIPRAEIIRRGVDVMLEKHKKDCK